MRPASLPNPAHRTRCAGWLAVLLTAAGFNAVAQPTLVAETRHPRRYLVDGGYSTVGGDGEIFSFALPGRRYVQCGTDDTEGGAQSSGLALTVVRQNTDTVRFAKPRTHPRGTGLVFVMGAVPEPDYSVTALGYYIATPASALNRDSVLLLRVDTLGVVRWRRGYALTNQVGAPRGLLRTGDGYLFCANRLAFPGVPGPAYTVPHVTKVDFAGRIVWERSMGSRGYGNVGGVFDLVAHPDGSYLALGYADDGSPYAPGAPTFGRNDYFVSKFTTAGDTLRTFRFGQPGVHETGTHLRLTPDGGAATIGFRYRPNSPPGIRPQEGQVFQLDSLFRPRWSQTLVRPQNGDWRYDLLQPLATGEVLCGGFSALPTAGTTGEAALTRYAATGALQWDYRQRYLTWGTGFNTMVNHPDGSALLTGVTSTGTTSSTSRVFGYATYLTNVGVPYVPDLCARPPAAYFVAAAAGPAAVQVLESSTPGPRYGVLVAWRWAWGDGTFSDGRAPGPHAYAAPLPGTALTLTVTNNLGCTASRTEYPFGPLSAAQQAQALAGRLMLYPNPTAGAVAVELGGLAPQGPAALAMLNPLGQVLRTATAPVRNGQVAATLDLGGLPAGLYLLRVTTREGTATKRVVKE